MPYREMYFALFHTITDVLSDLEQQNYGSAKERLINAQLSAEDLYIEGVDEENPQGVHPIGGPQSP